MHAAATSSSNSATSTFATGVAIAKANVIKFVF